MQYKLCETGNQLFQRYCDLAERYGLEDPRTGAAWDEWLLHKRGDASKLGCEQCNGLKGGKMGNPYKPKRVTGCLDLLFLCVLAWVIIMVILILAPELFTALLR